METAPVMDMAKDKYFNGHSSSLHPDLYRHPPEFDSSRRRSTMHSYTLSCYHTIPTDMSTMRTVRQMTGTRALKNVIFLGLAFMFVYTAFVSLLSLQSSMHWEGGAGVASLSCIYGTTVLSCLLAPWLISKLSPKWTMVIAFILFTGYFAGNFYPEHSILMPLAVILGLLAGPLWSSQATTITTIALTHAEHSHIADQDAVINKFMGIFCGLYRSSYIWGNLITTLVFSDNQTLTGSDVTGNFTSRVCGASDCKLQMMGESDYEWEVGSLLTSVSDNTKYMLLSIYLGCGVMGTVILISLVDNNIGSKSAEAEFSLSSKELFLSTLKMLTDFKCQLLMLLVLFVGLEQGFMFGDFTRSYVSCTLGVQSLGPILMCFGAVSAISSVAIGYVGRHIKRFAFVTAGATFNSGLLIVLWLWRPFPTDIPNFFVVASCLGLCDAIWQTQTQTLFGVLFVDKQEAAFASYRMFYATGCAIAFGYSYFLCVETKVYILAGVLLISLLLYSVIEMKVQLQSQHIKDIVAL
ncbi:hypothetical protein ScPMuIL_005412 [Solemya velum]